MGIYFSDIIHTDNEPFIFFSTSEDGGTKRNYRVFPKKGRSDGVLREFRKYLYAIKIKKGNPYASQKFNEFKRDMVDIVQDTKDKLDAYWNERYGLTPEDLQKNASRLRRIASSVSQEEARTILQKIADKLDEFFRTNESTLFFDEVTNQGIEPETAVKVLDIAKEKGLSKMAGVGKSKYLDSPTEVLEKVLSEKIVFFDTETTGLHSFRSQITEIAALVTEGPDLKQIAQFHKSIELDPQTTDMMKREEKAIQMVRDRKSFQDIKAETKLPSDLIQCIIKKGDRHYGIAKCLKEQEYYTKQTSGDELNILNEFYDFMAQHASNAIVIGHNVEYDLRMVNTRLGRKIPFKEAYDTMYFARLYVIPALYAKSEGGDVPSSLTYKSILDYKGKPMASLPATLKMFSIGIQGWHGAMADVQSTKAALTNIVEYFKQNNLIFQDPKYKQKQDEQFLRTLNYKRGLVPYASI